MTNVYSGFMRKRLDQMAQEIVQRNRETKPKPPKEERKD